MTSSGSASSPPRRQIDVRQPIGTRMESLESLESSDRTAPSYWAGPEAGPPSRKKTRNNSWLFLAWYFFSSSRFFLQTLTGPSQALSSTLGLDVVVNLIINSLVRCGVQSLSSTAGACDSYPKLSKTFRSCLLNSTFILVSRLSILGDFSHETNDDCGKLTLLCPSSHRLGPTR